LAYTKTRRRRERKERSRGSRRERGGLRAFYYKLISLLLFLYLFTGDCSQRASSYTKYRYNSIYIIREARLPSYAI
jgi:hypothetical protein